MEGRLNTLRTGVLGLDDRILTVVSVLVSMAAVTSDRFTIFVAGLSDLLARVSSMTSGKYTSISTQRDAEEAAVAKEEQLLKNDYEGEFATVEDYYASKRVTPEIPIKVAKDLLNKKPLETAARIRYDVELGHYFNPWDAAFSSLFSAAAGGLIPLMAMILAPETYRWYVMILIVIFTSALTGYINFKLGSGLVRIVIIRSIIIGSITITIHYGVGKLFQSM